MYQKITGVVKGFGEGSCNKDKVKNKSKGVDIFYGKTPRNIAVYSQHSYFVNILNTYK